MTASGIGQILNLRGLMIALPLVVFVLVIGWWYATHQKKRRQKPGQYLRYHVPTLTAASCRGLLGQPQSSDLFAYTLQSAAGGGWYITFTQHTATQQPLDTVFLLQFENEAPAEFSLTFTREAFGMREPVISEDLLDSFFSSKLGAQRLSVLSIVNR